MFTSRLTFPKCKSIYFSFLLKRYNFPSFEKCPKHMYMSKRPISPATIRHIAAIPNTSKEWVTNAGISDVTLNLAGTREVIAKTVVRVLPRSCFVVISLVEGHKYMSKMSNSRWILSIKVVAVLCSVSRDTVRPILPKFFKFCHGFSLFFSQEWTFINSSYLVHVLWISLLYTHIYIHKHTPKRVN